MARRKAPKTWAQIERMHQKAIRFLRSVVGDEEKAQEFEGLSTEQYAERKGIRVAENPSRQNADRRSYRNMAKRKAAPTRAELEDRVEELEGEVESLETELEEVTDERDELAEQVEAVAQAIGVEEAEEDEDEDSGEE